jgi:hypothetical protein
MLGLVKEPVTMTQAGLELQKAPPELGKVGAEIVSYFGLRLSSFLGDITVSQKELKQAAGLYDNDLPSYLALTPLH